MYLLTRARHLPAAGAALVCGLGAVFALGAAGPAAALGPGAAAVAGDDGSSPGDGLTLTPATGRSGASIAVSALCASETDHATVSSPAFARPVALHQGEGGAARAQATVKSGLTPGKSYVVTANCSETESLTSSFVHIGPPTDASAAEGGGSPQQEGGVGNAAIAFGGGLATAGLAGYLLTVRRASADRNRKRPAERARPAERVRPAARPAASREPAGNARPAAPAANARPAAPAGNGKPVEPGPREPAAPEATVRAEPAESR